MTETRRRGSRGPKKTAPPKEHNPVVPLTRSVAEWRTLADRLLAQDRVQAVDIGRAILGELNNGQPIVTIARQAKWWQSLASFAVQRALPGFKFISVEVHAAIARDFPRREVKLSKRDIAIAQRERKRMESGKE